MAAEERVTPVAPSPPGRLGVVRGAGVRVEREDPAFPVQQIEFVHFAQVWPKSPNAQTAILKRSAGAAENMANRLI
jgi:hypothetical protein